MVNVSNPDCTGTFYEKADSPSGIYYVVYDICVINGIPSWDLAFIEERNGILPENVFNAEKRFFSLKDAKSYARSNFESGAEYISLNQLADPNNLLHIIADKISYLIA
ncbi:hypothetical protein [Dyadobacter sp. NIV53]|uniref:hypothetical protein n=1 Tax=Dyadobacter sp. NIV53 TaxID=2861765 RepID=UPI001C8722F2|nr:hypothetical protein [Dyadobacter sp. NIV53]